MKKKKKKLLARILIEGYEDPNTGIRTLDLHYDGREAEIVALLLKSAVGVCRDHFHFSDDRIIELFKLSTKDTSGDHHD